MKFTIKDFVFAAMMTAAIFVASSIAIAGSFAINFPGARSLLNAFPMAFILTIAVAGLRKPGSLTLVLGLYGLITLMIHPIITSFVLISALIADGICFAIFRNYEGRSAQLAGPVIQQAVMLPVTFLLAMLIWPDQLEGQAVGIFFAVVLAAVIALAAAGAFVGGKVVTELQRTGRLQTGAS